MITMWAERLLAFSQKLFDAVLSPEEERKAPWLSILWPGALYLLGVFLWGKFFSWNTGPLNYHDWPGINIPRLDMMRDALRVGTLPFHIIDRASLMDVSDRFFVLPDVITTPQMVLLLFVNLSTFVIIDVLLHYTIGVLGLLWLRKRRGLALFPFTILFLLFNFNGYILGHYSVGHFTWGAYFLFPIFFELIFEFLEREVGWRWVTIFSLVLFYMILAGGQHHFVWLLLFLAPLLLTTGKRAKWLVALIISAGLLSACRLLPPVLALSEYGRKQNFNFVLGYPSVGHLLQSMILPTVPVESLIKPFGLNSFSENIWEFYYYVGILGTLFLLYFGVWHWFRYSLKEYFHLVLPTLFIIFLALGGNYWLVRESGIPLFGSERVTSRMISVPITILMILAVIFFQRWLQSQYEKRLVLTMAGFSFTVLLFSDLWENLKLWQLNNYAGYFAPVTLNLDGNSVANRSDPAYYTVILIGLGITALTALFLLLMNWRERRLKRALHNL
jgi:hypothetical protein